MKILLEEDMKNLLLNVSKHQKAHMTIESPHLDASGVTAKKYYREQLWKELFGEGSELPWWMS